MDYSNDLSWFNSPSLPSSSSFGTPRPFLPVSPPAPHRRAPAPPAFSPRRRRARHMRLSEPASKGLFTLKEVDETEPGDLIYRYGRSVNSPSMRSVRLLSARASSELLSPSPIRPSMDLPQDVREDGEEELVVMENRLSWVSASTTTNGTTTESSAPPTPNFEMEDDPFFVDVPLDVDAADLDTSYTTFLAGLLPPQSRPRRPPPLDLSRTHPYAYSADINRWSTEVSLSTPKTTTPPSTQIALLPPLPILSPKEYMERQEPKTPRTPKPRVQTRKAHSAPPGASVRPDSDPFDLVSALENLLASCGEPDDIIDPYAVYGMASTQQHTPASSDSESDQHISQSLSYAAFPLPPPRTPILSPASASSSSSFNSTTPLTPRSPRQHSSLPPRCPREQKKRQPIQPKFMGDHSFLFAMSRGEDVPPVPPLPASAKGERPDSRGSSRSKGSGSGSSKGGRLPQRARLPMEWTQV